MVPETQTLEKKDRMREAFSSFLQEEGEEEKTEEEERHKEIQSFFFGEVRYFVWSCRNIKLDLIMLQWHSNAYKHRSERSR